MLHAYRFTFKVQCFAFKVQLFYCSNVHLFYCSIRIIPQISTSPNSHILKFPHPQISTSSNFHIPKFPHPQIPTPPNLQISTSPHPQIFKILPYINYLCSGSNLFYRIPACPRVRKVRTTQSAILPNGKVLRLNTVGTASATENIPSALGG